MGIIPRDKSLDILPGDFDGNDPIALSDLPVKVTLSGGQVGCQTFIYLVFVPSLSFSLSPAYPGQHQSRVGSCIFDYRSSCTVPRH